MPGRPGTSTGVLVLCDASPGMYVWQMRAAVMRSPREALFLLLSLLDEVEKSKCKICIPPSLLSDGCARHESRLKRTLAEARAALLTGDN